MFSVFYFSHIVIVLCVAIGEYESILRDYLVDKL